MQGKHHDENRLNRDHGDGSDTTLSQPGDPKNANRTLHIAMNDTMRFTSSAIKVKQSDTVKFLVTNIGKIKHEMVIDTQAELQEHAALMRSSSCSYTTAFPLPALPTISSNALAPNCARTSPSSASIPMTRLYPSTSSVR